MTRAQATCGVKILKPPILLRAAHEHWLSRGAVMRKSSPADHQRTLVCEFGGRVSHTNAAGSDHNNGIWRAEPGPARPRITSNEAQSARVGPAPEAVLSFVPESRRLRRASPIGSATAWRLSRQIGSAIRDA